MRNIAPKRALARRSRRLLTLAVFSFLIGLVFSVLALLLFVVPLLVPSNPSFDLYNLLRTGALIFGVLLIILAVVMVVRALTWRMDNPLAQVTGEALSEFLGDEYLFLRNVSKSALGYIDAILIGPPGALIFRIIDREGVFFNEGKRWMLQREKGEWLPMRWSPTVEAVEDIQKLRAYLARHDLEQIQVWGVIVMTQPPPQTQVTVDNALVPVAFLDELSYKLSDTYFAKDRVSPSDLAELANLLMN